jgi:NAD(P)-dependent dehydrogenase (short-subunit alcohol dehydrogenase family)
MKTWLITGVARGLGKALAEAALARGDSVIGTVRGEEPRIGAGTGTFHCLRLEMRDLAAIEKVVTQAFELGGRVDVLVNNAGYGLLGAIEAASDAEMTRLFEVNVFGPIRLIRAALPRLRAQRAGHIINITSIAGLAPRPGAGIYAATKSALEGLSEALALECAPLGIHVTAVAPGAFRTDFLSEHSIRRSGSPDDYVATAGSVVRGLDAIAGKQPGDPVRAARAILEIADSEQPPVHLLLGSDALSRARERLDATIEAIDHWERLTSSTDIQT